jgi:molecular chaperone DnaJ
MNLQEAYNIVGASENTPDDELKQIYKSAAKKYHPDVYSDKEKFKIINEAYQLIIDSRQHPEKYSSPFGSSPFGSQGGFGINISDLFNNFGGQQQTQARIPKLQDPQLSINLTFKQSILGHEQEIKYSKATKCETCDGQGVQLLSNGCKHCNGFGRIMQQNGQMMFSSTCGHCRGQNIKNNKCNACSAKGYILKETIEKINIPPGITNNATLRVQNAGNYQGASIFGEAYGNVILNIKVEKDNELELVGNDVVFNLKLSLLDALSGCQKEVKTINGTQNINVLPLSKNKDEIVLSGLGVKDKGGVERIVLSIAYPDDIDKLKEYLKGN